MDEAVADSGVFVRWFLKQPGWQHAREIRHSFLEGSLRLHTADRARIETVAVLRAVGMRRHRALDEETFVAAARTIDDVGVIVHAIDVDRLERIARLTATRMLGVYDAAFVVLALELGLPLLTSDARLCRAVDGLLSTVLLRPEAP